MRRQRRSAESAVFGDESTALFPPTGHWTLIAEHLTLSLPPLPRRTENPGGEARLLASEVGQMEGNRKEGGKSR
jgi:hypothetical protein